MELSHRVTSLPCWLTCPLYRSSLLHRCWTHRPTGRPSASEIMKLLSLHPRLVSPCIDVPLASVQMEDSGEEAAMGTDYYLGMAQFIYCLCNGLEDVFFSLLKGLYTWHLSYWGSLPCSERQRRINWSLSQPWQERRGWARTATVKWTAGLKPARRCLSSQRPSVYVLDTSHVSDVSVVRQKSIYYFISWRVQRNLSLSSFFKLYVTAVLSCELVIFELR